MWPAQSISQEKKGGEDLSFFFKGKREKEEGGHPRCAGKRRQMID